MRNLTVLKSVLFLLWCLFFIQNLSSQNNNKITLNLEGKTYEKIQLRIILDRFETFKTEGISNNKQKWIFEYPDSIYNRHLYMSFVIPTSSDTIEHRVSFNILSYDKDTLGVGSLSFKKPKTTINAKFYERSITEKMPFFRFKDFWNDIFIISQNDDKDLFAMAESMYNGYSMFDRSPDTLSYSERLHNYVKITQQYPQSHYLISHLSQTLTFYKSKKDIEKVFNCFTEENKQSYFGKKIEKYLSTNYFENSILPSWDTGRSEPIIKDTTRYNLVVFSASWCGPCHKQIPLLKNIYNDLHQKLDIVYVSLDEQKTIDTWRQLMKKENIPWRSVITGEKMNEIKEKYTAQTIPHTLFIHPGGYMEVMDIREQNILDKIYNQVQNK